MLFCKFISYFLLGNLINRSANSSLVKCANLFNSRTKEFYLLCSDFTYLELISSTYFLFSSLTIYLYNSSSDYNPLSNSGYFFSLVNKIRAVTSKIPHKNIANFIYNLDIKRNII